MGAAIVEKLCAENFETTVLLNSKSRSKQSFANLKVQKVIQADLTDFGSVKKLSAIGKIDAVIHSAGLAHQFGQSVEADFQRINVVGTENIAKLAVLTQAEHLMLISSVAVYGKRSEGKSGAESNPVTEETVCQPDDFYSRSKLGSEIAAQAVCADNGLNLTILRPSTVIGENDRGNVARLIKAIDDSRFMWIGSGGNLKSLIYKDDLARACLCVLNRKRNQTGEKSEIFNVTAEALPMSEIVSEIHKQLGKKNPRFHISPSIIEPFFHLNQKTFNIRTINRLYGTINKWLSDDIFSGDKIRKQHGFKTEMPIPEAIRKEVESYKNQK